MGLYFGANPEQREGMPLVLKRRVLHSKRYILPELQSRLYVGIGHDVFFLQLSFQGVPLPLQRSVAPVKVYDLPLQRLAHHPFRCALERLR